LPREGKELRCQSCAALSRCTYSSEQPGRGFIAASEPCAEQFEVAEDRCQKIVEVVCDPTSKLADRLHFLGLMKLILDVLHFGDVARAGDDKLLTFVPFRNENEQDIDRPRQAGHRAPRDVTLVLAGPQTGAHVPEWQLSRLNAQHLLEAAPTT
jgi:hypothetical protein